MSERLKFLGRRQELELEKKSLEIRFRGLIDNLRDELDPLKPIDEMRPDAVATLTEELDMVKQRTCAVVAELKKISDLIGK